MPDILASWARRVPPQLVAELESVGAVLASGPPFSALVAGLRLAKMLQVPVVLEIRDPPSADRRARRRGHLAKRRLALFERRYLGSADKVIVVTPGVKRKLVAGSTRIRADRVHVVPNGAPVAAVEGRLSGRRPGIFTVSYVGSFRSADDLKTLIWIAERLLDLGARAELRIVGPHRAQTNEFGELIDRGVIEVVGRVSHAAAVAEIATSDVSLVLAHQSEEWWIGRKVFESLALAPRILGVVPAGDTDDLLERSAKSLVVRPGRREDLMAAVDALHRQWQDGELPEGSEPEVPTDLSTVRGIADVLNGLVGTMEGNGTRGAGGSVDATAELDSAPDKPLRRAVGPRHVE